MNIAATKRTVTSIPPWPNPTCRAAATGRLCLGAALVLGLATPALAVVGPSYVPPVAVTAPVLLYNAGTGVYPNIGRVGVDNAGNVFFVSHTGSSGTLFEIPYAAPAVTIATPTTLITGLGQYNSDAAFVDANGNLWIANGNGSNGIIEVPASSSGVPDTSLVQNVTAASITTACTAAPTTACSYADNTFATNVTNYYVQPSDIIVATLSGTTYVYFVDYYDGNTSGKYNRVVRFSTASPGAGTVIADEITSNNVAELAVDNAGNVYYADSPQGGGGGNLYDFGTATGLSGGGTASAGAVTGIAAYQVGTSPTIATAAIASTQGIGTDRFGNLYVVSTTQVSEVPNEAGTLNFADEFGVAGGLSNQAVYGPAIDANGNIYYASYSSVDQLQYGGYNFGSVTIGSSTATAGPSLSLYFNQTTVISGNYFPTGSPTSNSVASDLQSFPYSGTKTCGGGGTSYAPGSTCNVTVNFQPIYPGLLKGSYTPRDSSSDEEVVVNLQGVGVGPELLFAPGTTYSLFTSAQTSSTVSTPVTLNAPFGIAVDTFGDVFVADAGNAKVVADCLAATTSNVTGNSFCSGSTGYPGEVVELGIGFTSPAGIALDGANNLYVTDNTANTVTEIQSDNLVSTQPVTASSTFGGTALSGPTGIALDGDANIYIADTGNNRIVEAHQYGAGVTDNTVYIPASVTFGGTALKSPVGLALDYAGDLFIADKGNNRIVEYSAAGVASVVNTGTLTLNAPSAVVVTPSGYLFAADSTDNIWGIPAGGGNGKTLSIGAITPTAPQGLALDLAGNLYLADTNGDQVVESVLSSPSPVVFPSTPQYSTSSAVANDGATEVADVGNASLILSGLALDSGDANFSISSSTCTSSSTLTPATGCELIPMFTPQTTGNLAGAVTLTDNMLDYALNTSTSNETATYATTGTQTVALSGTATAALTAQTIAFPQPATPVQYGVGPVTLTATASSNLPVTYSVTGPATISGSTLTFTGAGSVMVTASQAGNGTYAAATPVSVTIVVNGGSAQAILFAPLANYSHTATPTVPLLAVASSGLPIAYTATGPATVNGNNTLTLTGTGAVTVTAAQPGNATFSAATSVVRAFTAQ